MALLKPRMVEEALLAPRDLRVRAPTMFDLHQCAYFDGLETPVFQDANLHLLVMLGDFKQRG